MRSRSMSTPLAEYLQAREPDQFFHAPFALPQKSPCCARGFRASPLPHHCRLHEGPRREYRTTHSPCHADQRALQGWQNALSQLEFDQTAGENSGRLVPENEVESAI
jgi:hypothetical protein